MVLPFEALIIKHSDTILTHLLLRVYHRFLFRETYPGHINRHISDIGLGEFYTKSHLTEMCIVEASSYCDAGYSSLMQLCYSHRDNRIVSSPGQGN
ncbi:hypothetical protein TNCV_983671 [Trichonephila clavipes]|nr:hypothetical protein TNCV_983671 [Trichonephila clavipes]